MADEDNKPINKIDPESLEESTGSTDKKTPAGLPPEDDLSNTPSEDNSPSKKTFNLNRFFSFSNLYLVIFILLVVVAAGIVFAAIRLSKDDAAKTTPPQSLTDKQLAELKGSTTVIGDSEQVLDIQSSAVFEGQVLMRNSLDVAGTLKVGGPLSLSTVTVGGTSSFGQVQVNDTLTVAGNTTLQRNLAVSGSASFNGSLSVNQLNVTSLNLTGDITISRHIAVSGPTPSRTNGSALGSGGTASVSGTDTSGTVNINTGSGPPAGCFVTINFSVKFNSQPQVVISPSNSSAAALNYYVNRSATSFSICTTNAPSASTTYSYDYIAID